VKTTGVGNSPHKSLVRRSAQEPFFIYRKKDYWIKRTGAQFWSAVSDLAAAFQHHGLEKGERIALLMPSSYEWEIAHHAALLCGAVVVGIEAHAPQEHVQYLISHSGASAVVLSDSSQYEKLSPESLAPLKFVLANKAVQISHGIYLPSLWNWIEDIGPVLGFEDPHLNGDNPATLIYSSGSTGTPKGILYTHRQMILAIQEIIKNFEVEKGETLCWLPLSNLFQRILNLVALQTGSPVAIVEDPREVLSAIKDVKPTYLIGVPRFYEKLAAGIKEAIRELPLIKRLFVTGAIHLSRTALRRTRKQRTPNTSSPRKGEASPPAGWAGRGEQTKVSSLWEPSRILGFCDKRVFSRLRATLGGRMKFMVTGSAPLSPRIVEFFNSIGLPLLEAYGCSENIVPIAMNRLDDFEAGTVGRPLQANTVRISRVGEIQVKGPGVFQGYYNDPAGRARFTADGYYRTGDIGHFTKEGRIKLLSRKSDIIFTSTGRKILPTRIEEMLNRLPHVENAVVFGNNRKTLVALFTLRHPDEGRPPSERKRELAEALKTLNQQLASYERISAFAVLERPLSMKKNEITLNLKLRRAQIEKNHRAIINRLYEDDAVRRQTVRR
jgi:long-chain acyl-CoA synthetase